MKFTELPNDYTATLIIWSFFRFHSLSFGISTFVVFALPPFPVLILFHILRKFKPRNKEQFFLILCQILFGFSFQLYNSFICNNFVCFKVWRVFLISINGIFLFGNGVLFRTIENFHDSRPFPLLHSTFIVFFLVSFMPLFVFTHFLTVFAEILTLFQKELLSLLFVFRLFKKISLFRHLLTRLFVAALSLLCEKFRVLRVEKWFKGILYRFTENFYDFFIFCFNRVFLNRSFALCSACFFGSL